MDVAREEKNGAGGGDLRGERSQPRTGSRASPQGKVVTPAVVCRLVRRGGLYKVVCATSMHHACPSLS